MGGAGFSNPGLGRVTQITAATATVPAGVAGWIDTDVSAIVGTDPHKIWNVLCVLLAAGEIGARNPGSAADSKLTVTHTQLVSCDVNGHMELYRTPGTDTYFDFMGYLQ